MELRTGTRVDRYELIAPIATGGMGSVWLARVRRSADFERFFAVKTVLPQYAADPGFRKMFLDETRIASAISHANVAQIIDLGEHDGTLYMVMEWVDGDSLHALSAAVEANGQRVEPAIALRVVADACAGLHAVHEARDRGGKPLEIVHRDLSPHNILISEHGQPKLVDFGVARARDRLADTTSSGTLKGKIRYMSPEHAAGESIDRRSDLWGIGAVLYRLLEGRCPVDADNNYAVLRMLLQRTPPAPMSATAAAPLAGVVMRCLEVDASKRFQTAEELHRALEWVMVELRLTASTSDVAAYVRTHLGDVARRRHATIETTLAELERSPEGQPLETPGPLSDPRGGASSLSLVTVETVPLASDTNSPGTRDVTVLLQSSPRALAHKRARILRWGVGALVVSGAVVTASVLAERGRKADVAVSPIADLVAAGGSGTAVAPPTLPPLEPRPPVAPMPPPTASVEARPVDAELAPAPSASAKSERPKVPATQATSATKRTRVSSAPSDVFDDRK